MSYTPKNPNGQDTMSDSSPVVIASDQSAIPVSATNLDVRDLTFAADKVDASGTVLGAGNNNIGDVDVASVPAPLNVTGGGTEAAALRVTIANNSTGVVSVDDNGASLTVDGTVVVQGTLDTLNQIDLTNSDPLAVAVVDGNGDQITSFGGGVQYTEEDTDSTITGTAMMMEDAGDTLVPAQGDATNGLLVNLGTNNDVTVTGTVAVTQSGTWDEVGINDSGNSITVDDGGASLTVDGAVTVSATNLDIRDLTAASDTVTVHGDVGALDQLDLTNSNPAVVAIVDGNGDQITSFGGGTQYTEDAAAAANPVGNALIAIRDDVRSGSLTSTDGDNIALRGTNAGELYVKHVDPIIVVTETEFPLEVFTTSAIDVKLRDGDSGVFADVLDLTNSNPVAVAIVDSNGTQVSSFGGGTQYTQGDTDASITGTAMLMEGGSDTLLPVQGTVADGLLVNLGGNNDVTVTGTVTTQDTALQDVLVNDGSAAQTRLLQVGGTDGTNAQILSTNSSGHVNIADGGNAITVDGTVGVSGTVAVTQSGTWDEVGINDSGNSITVDAPVGTPVFATITPSATGGWDCKNCTSADGSTALTNSAQAIKASQGTFGGYYIYNPNATAVWVHIYNVASGSVTVGTTNPTCSFCIPATAGANLEITNGVQFSTAMSASATSTAAGNGAPTTALEAMFFFK